VVYFAQLTPGIAWWPSDLNEQHLKSIAARRAHAQAANIREARRIDLSEAQWWPQDVNTPGALLAIVCANVIHIAPWRVAEGLFAGAGRYLRDDGRLFLSGPFKRDGAHTAPSPGEALLRLGVEWVEVRAASTRTVPAASPLHPKFATRISASLRKRGEAGRTSL
jgi:hypothetical protein